MVNLVGGITVNQCDFCKYYTLKLQQNSGVNVISPANPNMYYSVLFLLLLMVLVNFHYKSLQGELWGWTCFYVGVAAVAFGSSYYHLKPNDDTLVWDRLPVSSVPSVVQFIEAFSDC
jgi:NADH:ubiquinone oxidoreductase subunit 6 (subunit J)